MAIASRRRRSDIGVTYWPGFVDAMATMLLVIIFLLSIFMLAQFFLSREVTGRDNVLGQLRSRIAELTELLALEEANTSSLQASLSGLSEGLGSADAEKERLASLIDVLSLKNSDLEQRIIVLQDELESEQSGKTAALAALEQRQQVVVDLRSAEEKQALLIASQRESLEQTETALEAARAAADAAESRIVDLRTEAEKREGLLAALTADLDTERLARSNLETELEDQKLLVVDLRGQAEQAEINARDIAANLQSETEALAALRERLEADEKRRQERDAAAAETERRLVVLQNRIDRTEAEQAEAEKSLEERERELIVLQSRLQDAEQSLSQAQDAVRQQEQIVVDLRKQRGLAGDQVASLESALAAEAAAKAGALNQIELLNLQLNQLRRQIGVLEAALDASEARDAAQKTQITNLGRRLNVALAQKVQELSRYRSEFFGRLREILSQRSDIRVVGDRFVFQSEVLFGSGQASINEQGFAELDKLANALIELEREIPPELNWVLRVDGHTDQRPIFTSEFQSNWELSSARAISVVQYLVARGVNPQRLVAAGFGEFQPLDANDDDEAFRRNRRIELKLTER